MPPALAVVNQSPPAAPLLSHCAWHEPAPKGGPVTSGICEACVKAFFPELHLSLHSEFTGEA